MPDRVLTRRDLNRATLARQLLLSRSDLSISDAIEQVVGLQAQVQNPPYIGLWTRLRNFQKDDLTRLIQEKQVVRATLMRSTLHLMTAHDFLRLQPALRPAIVKGLRGVHGPRIKTMDFEQVAAVARAALVDGPRSFSQFRPLLAAAFPDQDEFALAHAIRAYVPLVQVPPAGSWGVGGNTAYAIGDEWLGAPFAENTPDALILRYLGAFGPASVADVQAWAGIANLKGAVEALRPQLRTFRDENGKELFDLPDAPLPDADTPAPVRFLPEYDNLILSHADRTRVMPTEFKSAVFLSAARVRSTILVDGVVSGVWKIEKGKGSATLVIEPFAPLPASIRQTVEEEGDQLLRWVEDTAKEHAVRIV